MSSNNEVLNFPYGGYVVVRCQDKGFFCMIDVGEVGMSGRGGHGHNDLLSFELCISGQPVVIDPGCSGYTADLNKKNYYRKTSSHATVEIFNEEMARFGGHWIIHDDAQPLEVSVSEKSGFVRICAGHNGYERIAHNTRIFRVLEVNPEAQKVMITDEIRVPLNNVKIRWSFPLGALPVLSKKKLLLGSETPVVFFAELPVEIGDSFFSCGYGHESLGHVIKAETEVPAGCHRYRFEFHKANG
jgi:hypothetical protein